VGGQMWQFGMKFLAQVFDELSNLVLDVCHKGVTLRGHDQQAL
jgi:hypothetical protein